MGGRLPTAVTVVSTVVLIPAAVREISGSVEAPGVLVSGPTEPSEVFIFTAVPVLLKAELVVFVQYQYLLGAVETLQQFVLSVLVALIQTGNALLNQSPHHVVI